MKEYEIKVVEIHSDTVKVKAESYEEAINSAVSESECTFESVNDCEILNEREIKE